MNPDVMARNLGFFSIGLGATEIAAARSLAESLGMEGKEGMIQAYGAREIAQGIGCLSTNPPTAAVWTRVAGDVLDIATLLPFLSRSNPKRNNVKLALGAVLGVTLMDVLTGLWLCEGRSGPMTRLARRPLEQMEQNNEQQMRQTQAAGEDFASATIAKSSAES